ncbi:MAG: NifU family protein, partial [Kineosporiaceae bacterium]
MSTLSPSPVRTTIRVDLTPRASRRVRELIADATARSGADAPQYALRVSPAEPGPAGAGPTPPRPESPATDTSTATATGTGTGAAGFRLSLSPGAGPEDLRLPRNGFEVVLDREHAPALDGLRIDFLESADGAGFTLDLVRRPAPLGRSLPGGSAAADSGPASAGSPAPAPSGTGGSGPLRTRVQRALDLIRPDLRRDGGDVELVEVEAGTAMVRMVGACAGCSISAMTLTTLVEATVTAEVPEV